MTATIPSEAERLTAAGYTIFPLTPQSKEPLPGSNGWHGARRDPRPWQTNPTLNIGLPVAANGLVAFDIDGLWGNQRLAQLEKKLGPLPRTRTHRHGHGRHLLYRVPTPALFRTFTIDRNETGQHEEVRLIANGYLVAPPSVHPDGELYDLDDYEIVDLPKAWHDWILEQLLLGNARREQVRHAIPRDDRPGDDYNHHVTCNEILEQHGWSRGRTDGNGTHYTRPGKTHGTSAVVYHDNGKAHIFTSSTNLPDGQQYDPLGLLARLDFNGDFTAATRHIATLGYGNPERPLPPIEIAAAPATTIASNETDDELRSMILDWTTFWRKDHDDQQWLYEPFLPAGRAVAIYAPGGTGKSLFALWIALQIATGHDIHGNQCPPRHVLYGDWEMTEADLAERIQNMGYGPDTDLTHLHYALLPPIAPLDQAAGAASLCRLADLVAADLVIIDTFARAISGDENEADTVRAFYRHTGQTLKAAGRAMIRIDHAGKDTTRGARGTSAKRDDVDIVWQLTALDAGTLTLKAEKRRVSWVPETVTLNRVDTDDLENVAWRLAPESQHQYAAGTSALAAVLDQLDAPLEGTRTVADMLRTAGHKASNKRVRDAMKYRLERAPMLRARP